jgi:hypothetical protein
MLGKPEAQPILYNQKRLGKNSIHRGAALRKDKRKKSKKWT